MATLRPQKRAELFLNAVREANAADPHIRGMVVGGGAELERLRVLAAGSRLVEVLGERDDIADLLEAADVVCLSSDSEGMPMVILEAMAAGKPVVATDVVGIRETVEDEETGLLVPVGDERKFAAALVRLAADRDFAARLGRAGRRRHRELFDFERMIDEYGRLFGSVERHRGRSARRAHPS